MSETFHNQPGGAKITRFGLLQKLRRQFTSAGDWKSAIANSELLQEAQATITALVQQTKLMRFEKFEIAEELIAHFVDGLERGTTSDELISAFGDPEVAATLFRSSKLRRRPMAIKAGQMTLWTALASGAGYLALMGFFYASSPTPDVDYSIQMNQKAAAIPEDQRAWPVYREAWTKFKFSEGGGGSSFAEIFTKDDQGKITNELIWPQDKGWDVAVDKLAASSELLDALRAGSKLDHLGLELQVEKSDYSEADFLALFPNEDYATEVQKADGPGAAQLFDKSLISILIPHVHPFRQAARIFQVDTRLAVTENDPDRIVDNISAILGIARQQKNENILVSNLVGIAVFKMGVAQIEEVLRESPGVLNDAHLAQLQSEISRFDFTKIDVSGEQAFQRDIMQRIYTDDGDGDGRLTPEGLESLWGNPERNDDIWQTVTRRISGPALMLTSPGRKEVAEKMDALTEAVKSRFGSPWWEDDLADLNQPWGNEPSIISAPKLWLTKWGLINASHQIAIANQDAGLLGIAIERYRLKFDAWPQSMDDLEGEFLSATPLDRVTGEPLKFKASDESVTIYSVGGDLDDDGGEHDALTIPMAANYDDSVDGDWVLWPVDRE